MPLSVRVVPDEGSLERRKPVRRASGQGMTEYAVVLPVLVLLILGVIEFATVIYTYSTIANASREGARAGILPFTNPADREAAVLAAVLGHAVALSLTSSNVQITHDPGAGTVRVEVTYDVHLMSELIIRAIGGRAVIPLHTSTVMFTE